MQKTVILIMLISCNILQAKDETKRPVRIVTRFGGVQIIKTAKYAYDPAGNINSISVFLADGDLAESEFFFYGNGCMRKSLKYRAGKLKSRSMYGKDASCRTLTIKSFDPQSRLRATQEFEYTNGVLESSAELDHKGNKATENRYFYESNRLVRMESRGIEGQETMNYKYLDDTLSSLEYQIIEPNGEVSKGVATIEYENGPITPEAFRTFFE